MSAANPPSMEIVRIGHSCSRCDPFAIRLTLMRMNCSSVLARSRAGALLGVSGLMSDRLSAAARAPLMLALSCVGLVSLPARAGEVVPVADGIEQRPDIVVTGTRQRDSGYRVGDSVSAMRTGTPLIDTPQSASVVSAQQIEDQAANGIGEAIRYTPGVFSAQGEGNRETLIFRGMTTTGDFFVDGVRDDVQTYRDLYNIERLEIFRGPNAMIFGRGGTGGIINRVTRVAGWQTVRELRLEAGMYDHYRGSLDFGGPLGDRVALRVAGVYQNSGSYRDGVRYERWGANPTASFRLGADPLIEAGYEHFRDDRTA